jgi:hypothetical protein
VRRKIKCYIKNKNLTVANVVDRVNCELSAEPKHTRRLFSQNAQVSGVLSVVCSDLEGPLNVQSWCGGKYFQLLIDKYSGFTLIWVLAYKESRKVTDNILSGIERTERESGKCVIKLLTDDGGQFGFTHFLQCLEQKKLLMSKQ